MENLSLVDDRFWSLLGIDVNGWRQPKTTVLPIRVVVSCRRGHQFQRLQLRPETSYLEVFRV